MIQTILGRVNQHFENLTQDCACQTSIFFLLAPPWEKQDMSGFPDFQLQLELRGPAHSSPGELRAQPWHRLRSVWNMGLMI